MQKLKKIRVLFVAGIFPPDIGGPASYVPLLANYLVSRGHEVKVVCFSELSYYEKDSQFNFTIYRILRKQNLLIRELNTIVKLIKLARNCDIIYSNGNDFKSHIAGLFSNVPVVHKIVGDTAWERARNRRWYSDNIDNYQIDKKPFKLRLLDWVRSYPLRKAKLIITPSEYLGRIVKMWMIDPQKVKVIFNAFTPNQIKAQSSLNLPTWSGKTLVTVCRLVPWKHVDQIIQAIKNLNDVRLIVVGDGPLRNELENQAKQLGQKNKVFFTGNVSKTDVENIMRQSDAFILNSTYEGLPHVVLEAFHCNLPVIATNAGGTPEVVLHGKTGLLIQPGNSKQLKDSIRDALTIIGQYHTENAQQFLKSKFSLERMLEETEQALIQSTDL